MGGSERLEKGCTAPADRNTVGGAGTGGLMTSCRDFLFAHRKKPEECKDGGRVTAGASVQTHSCMMEGWVEWTKKSEDGCSYFSTPFKLFC